MLNVFVLLAADATLNVVADRLRLAVAASWVTVIVLSVTPVPDIVIVAVLVAAKVLVVAVMVIAPLLEPLAVPTVNHAWLLATVQLVFEVILKLAVLLAADATLKVVTDILRLAVAASWVTVMVLSATPVPDMVMMAVLVSAKVLAVAVKVIDPLLEPPAVPTVNHAWLLDTVQLVLDVMLKLAVLFAAEATLNVVVEMFRLAVVGTPCVTVIVFESAPIADRVIMAVRLVPKRFPFAMTVIEALFEPEPTLILNQGSLLVNVQLVFEIILNVSVLFSVPATLNVFVETLMTFKY
jgi:hypothetical protein